MLARFLLSSCLCVLASPALAQDGAPKDPEQIVVTGKPLSATEKELADCIARHCTPDREIAAAIAHAENQFVAGRYEDAKATLAAASRRNKGFAKQYPVPVSDLLRAGSRVAAHMGEGSAYLSGAFDVISALKAGLPHDDSRILVARTELADAYVKLGRTRAAAELYRQVAADAKRLKQPMVEGFALFRDAALTWALAKENEAYRGTAKAKLAAIVASTEPMHAPFAKAARVLQIRLAAREGDSAAVDALVAEYRAQPSRTPLLLSSDPVRLNETRVMSEGEQGSVTRLTALDNYEDQWIDVGFWIGPDGRATDVDIIRDSGKADAGWTGPVLASVRSRRYAPLAVDRNEPGLYRVERYTFTANWGSVSGSRLRARTNAPRIEMLDLSVENAKPTALQMEAKG